MKTKHMVGDLSQPQQPPYLPFFFFPADFLLWALWQLLGQHLNFANVKEFRGSPGRQWAINQGLLWPFSREAEHVQADKSLEEGEAQRKETPVGKTP